MTSTTKMEYEYETISTFVSQLRSLDPEDLVNISIDGMRFINVKFMDKESTAKYTEQGLEWNVLAVQKGTSKVSDVLKVLEPFVEKHGTSIIQYLVGKTCEFMKRNAKIKKYLSFETLHEFRWNVSHLVEEQRISDKKAEFKKDLTEFKRLVKNDEELVKLYLIKTLPLYPEICIYYITCDMYYENLPVQFPNIPETQLLTYFVQSGENLFISNKTSDQLDEINKGKKYLFKGKLYTFAELQDTIELPEDILQKIFKPSKEDEMIFKPDDDKTICDLVEVFHNC